MQLGRIEHAIYHSKVQSANRYTTGSEVFWVEFIRIHWTLKHKNNLNLCPLPQSSALCEMIHIFWTQKLKFIPFPCKVFTSQNMHIIWDSSWIKYHIMSYNWIRIMWHRMFLQFTHNLKPRRFQFLRITNVQAYASMTKFWPSTLFSTIDPKDRDFVYSIGWRSDVDTCTPVLQKELKCLSFWIYYYYISITFLKKENKYGEQ